VLSWHEQLADAKKEIAELEERVSALRAELQTAQWATDAPRPVGRGGRSRMFGGLEDRDHDALRHGACGGISCASVGAIVTAHVNPI